MAFVEFAVKFVIGRLCEAFIQEIIFLDGVPDQVHLIEEEFKRTQSFLKDADAKQQMDYRARNWVRDVQNVANEIEDAIDTFAYKVAPLRQGAGFWAMFSWPSRKAKKKKAQHKLGSYIELIKAKIQKIIESRTTYGIERISQGDGTNSAGRSLKHRRPMLSHLHVVEPHFVGFQKELRSVIHDLIKDEQRLCVVSLVGMGGLGKTTLAKKVYQADAVKNSFSTRAWVCISEHYSVIKLLQVIGKQCPGFSMEPEETEEDVKWKISESLKGRRYLIVLDDLWKYKAWNALKDAFPDGSRGRVLLTTRKKCVAQRADARSKPIELPFLEKEESWQLFCKKAFPEEKDRTNDKEQAGREIVKYCGGLPLAIVEMGALLSAKNVAEWLKVVKRLSWEFTKGDAKISDTLSLSYRDLPSELKPCFLYLGVFPENCEFPANRLIQLWIAEGFLRGRGKETPEEVGEDVLNTLIERSIIQVAERSSNGLIKSCRMHNLLRDLSIWEAENEKFLDVPQPSNLSGCEGRRLAVHQVASEYVELTSCAAGPQSELFSKMGSKNWLERTWEFIWDGPNPDGSTPPPPPPPQLASLEMQPDVFLGALNLPIRRPRSVFLFDKEARVERRLKFPFGSFKLLRVLDIENVKIVELPEQIGKLVHLRYLRCASAKIQSLPSSMANLRYLQTLYVRRQGADKSLQIPPAVEKMLKCLRHLQLVTSVASGDALLPIGPPRANNFSDKVSRLPLEHFLSSNFLDKVPKADIKYEETVTLGGSEESSSVSELDIIDQRFMANSSPAGQLVKPRPLLSSCSLYFSGKLEQLPDFPSKLSKLTFSESSLGYDPLPLLEKLQNLLFLELLQYSYTGKEMRCSAQGFPKLQYFHLYFLPHLVEWTVEEGSMRYLSHMKIVRCKKLKMVPEGVKHLPELKTLTISDMPEQFMDRVRGEKGADWQKIKHIKVVSKDEDE